VNPEPENREEVTLFYAADGTSYLVANNMVETLKASKPEGVAGEFKPTMLFLTANPNGKFFVWPVPMPVPKEHIAYKAMEKWIRYPVLH
jgi:hypothetical protein